MRTLPCLVHDDGHVIAFGNTQAGRDYLAAVLAALDALRISGYRLADVEHDAACAGRIAAQGCPVCRVELPCGHSPLDAVDGTCEHWTPERRQQIAETVGRANERRVTPWNL